MALCCVLSGKDWLLREVSVATFLPKCFRSALAGVGRVRGDNDGLVDALIARKELTL